MISWDKWLLLSSRELLAEGADPAERMARIGHKRPMKLSWAQTIGSWSVDTPKEIMIMAGFDPKDKKVQNRYNVFKHRWGLRSSLQAHPKVQEAEIPFMALGEWVHVEVAHLLQHHRSDYNGETYKLVAGKFGILPVEALLYHGAMLHIQDFYGMTLSEYTQHEVGERLRLWERTGAMGLIQLPEVEDDQKED